ncbi:hypothetical protein MMC31_008074 [Peltigera leucophlebia]|nr:hypothetical protein [Peltigera leucophlebia]
MILLAEAFVDLLQLWDKGTLKLQPEHLLRDFIPVILIQILNRTLLTQSSEGGRSTHESPEISAYAILTLVAVSTLPWFDLLGTEIQSALEAERQFLSLSQHEWTKPSYIWIEKVTYGSSNLSEAYCLAAMNARKPPVAWSDRVSNLVHISAGSICKICEFLSSLEVYHGEPIWKLKASALEGLAFLPRLKTAGDNILKGQEGTKKEYFNYIPITWATVNNVKEVFMDADLLLEMMVLTVCNFRVDEYMENVVVNFMHDESDLAKAKAVVRMLCTQGEAGNFETRKDPHEALAGPIHGSDNNSDKITELEQCSDLVSFKAMIGYYVKAVLYHLRVRQASPSDQCQLRIELQAFLLSHIDHIQDNARYSKCNFLPAKTAAIFLNPCTSYYSWAHSTGAVSVSCPFSFAFFTSLLGSSPLRRGDCFPLLGRNYLAADLCFHLAVMSRMYNDYGSITRDRLEANINSINFPEFHTSPVHDPEAKKQDLETNLLALAQYERECVDTIAERLVTDLRTSFGDGAAKARGLTLFVGVTALYADMYVAKDFSDPKRKTQSEEGVSRHL